jgi:hypothetical protein
MEIDSASLREIEARDKNQEPRQYQVVSIKWQHARNKARSSIQRFPTSKFFNQSSAFDISFEFRISPAYGR